MTESAALEVVRAPSRLLGRCVPHVAVSARQILNATPEALFAGERRLEKWVSIGGLRVRVLLAVTTQRAAAWVQLGRVLRHDGEVVAGYHLELWHELQGEELRLRRSAWRFESLEAAIAKGREEAGRLAVPYRETASWTLCGEPDSKANDSLLEHAGLGRNPVDQPDELDDGELDEDEARPVDDDGDFDLGGGE